MRDRKSIPGVKRGVAAVAALGLATLSLVGCGGSTSEPTEAPVADTELSVALSWIKDVTFAGSYIADSKGYYRDAGFSTTNLVPPGGTSTDAQLIAGQVLVAFTNVETTAQAVQQGADTKIVGSLMQRSPMAVVSLDSAPLRTPQDLVGKRIAVSPGNDLYLKNFMIDNNLDPESITVVPANYDPMILAVGEVDGYLGYSFDEPNTLIEKGFPAQAMLLADFGFENLAQAYAVRGADLEQNRDALKAFFAAEIKGWRDNNADNALGTELTMKYGADAGLDEKHQVAQNRDQTPLIAGPNALLTITPERAETVLDNLNKSEDVDLTADQLFDLTLLEEVYAENPDLAK
jgi:ABC-type nitrate/sulfonate/bicarbonate transport system substrate-binding protein